LFDLKMDQKNLQSKKIPRIKIAGAVLVVFELAMLFANTAQASATGGNFLKPAPNKPWAC